MTLNPTLIALGGSVDAHKPVACPNLRRNRLAVAFVVAFNVIAWPLIVWAVIGVFE